MSSLLSPTRWDEVRGSYFKAALKEVESRMCCAPAWHRGFEGKLPCWQKPARERSFKDEKFCCWIIEVTDAPPSTGHSKKNRISFSAAKPWRSKDNICQGNIRSARSWAGHVLNVTSDGRALRATGQRCWQLGNRHQYTRSFHVCEPYHCILWITKLVRRCVPENWHHHRCVVIIIIINIMVIFLYFPMKNNTNSGWLEKSMYALYFFKKKVQMVCTRKTAHQMVSSCTKERKEGS